MQANGRSVQAISKGTTRQKKTDNYCYETGQLLLWTSYHSTGSRKSPS